MLAEIREKSLLLRAIDTLRFKWFSLLHFISQDDRHIVSLLFLDLHKVDIWLNYFLGW